MKLIPSITLCLSLVFSAPLLAATIGEKSPNLFGRTLSGDLFRLSSVKGPKVVNFFWVECKPCRQELPELRALEQKYPKVNFIVVHVSAGDEEAEAVQAFVTGLKASPKTVVLSSPMVQETFAFAGFPYTVVIGADGKIKASFQGYFGDKSIKKLDTVIKGL